MLVHNIRTCSEKLSERLNITKKDAEKFLKATLDVIAESVIEDPVREGISFRGYFTIIPYTRQSYMVVNPVTHKYMKVPKQRALRIRYGERITQNLNPPSI